MAMLVGIPSRGRAGRMKTPGRLPRHPAYPVRIFVHDSEYQQYIRHGTDPLELVPLQSQGIAAVRQEIGQWARSQGWDRFCMMDDDLQFLVRISEDDWRLRNQTRADVGDMLVDIDENLQNRHSMVSPSAREGNQHFGIGSAPQLVRVASRPLRVLAFRTDDFLACEHGRVEVMEDFDVTLQLLRRGRSQAVLGWWGNGQSKTQDRGGCSIYRDHEMQERSAIRLADLHPGFVHLRTKENKTDSDGFGTRTEVTISWKRAWEEGQRRARDQG